MVDVIDPAGLVRSQVVESDDGGLRLTLNGAENRKTLAGHFIAESFGSGVQHLAFASRDIFRHRRPPRPNSASRRWRSRRTTTTTSKRASASSRTSPTGCGPKHPLRPRRMRRVFPALQPELRRRVSSSRSSSGAAATRATARPMRHSASPRRSGASGPKACRESDRRATERGTSASAIAARRRSIRDRPQWFASSCRRARRRAPRRCPHRYRPRRTPTTSSSAGRSLRISIICAGVTITKSSAPPAAVRSLKLYTFCPPRS